MATSVENWIRIGSAASTNNTALVAESAKASTATKPATATASGRYVLDSLDDLGKVSLCAVTFLGTDAANETFNAKLWGWSQVAGTGVWIAHLLGEVAVTLGSRTATIEGTAYLLPDTIGVTSDYSYDASIEVNGGAGGGNGCQWFSFDPSGHQLIEIEVSRDSATAASMWPMYRRLGR